MRLGNQHRGHRRAAQRGQVDAVQPHHRCSGAPWSTRPPGVTRDRIAETDRLGGPRVPPDRHRRDHPLRRGRSREFDSLVTEIARHAIAEADVVLFLVDGQVGPLAWDEADRPRPAPQRQARRGRGQQGREGRTEVRPRTSSTASDSASPIRSAPCTASASATCWTRSSRASPSAASEKPCDCAHRDPRPPQRRQVEPAEPAGRPRGGPGQRDRRHHARLDPHRPRLARPDAAPDRHGRPAPQVARRGGRSRSSATCAPSAPWRNATSRC